MSQTETKARRKCPVVVIANPKGGVGKTTTIINLAHALGIQSYRVLVLDLDPMRTATLYSGKEPLDGFIEGVSASNDSDFSKLVVPRVGFHLIPAGPNLGMTETSMSDGEMNFGWVKRLINEFRRDYDVILIDTAPGRSALRWAAISAATNVLVPVDPSPAAIHGLQRIGHEAKVFVPKKATHFRFITPFLSRYYAPSSEILLRDTTRVAEALTGTILSSVRDAKFVRESQWERESVFTYKLGSGVGRDYFELAECLAEMIGVGR